MVVVVDDLIKLNMLFVVVYSSRLLRGKCCWCCQAVANGARCGPLLSRPWHTSHSAIWPSDADQGGLIVRGEREHLLQRGHLPSSASEREPGDLISNLCWENQTSSGSSCSIISWLFVTEACIDTIVISLFRTQFVYPGHYCVMSLGVLIICQWWRLIRWKHLCQHRPLGPGISQDYNEIHRTEAGAGRESIPAWEGTWHQSFRAWVPASLVLTRRGIHNTSCRPNNGSRARHGVTSDYNHGLPHFMWG